MVTAQVIKELLIVHFPVTQSIKTENISIQGVPRRYAHSNVGIFFFRNEENILEDFEKTR